MNRLYLSYSRNPITDTEFVDLYINDKFIVKMFRYPHHNKVGYSDSLIDPLLFDSYPFLEMFRSYKQFRKSLIYLVSDV